MISIIVACNNKTILENVLISSLDMQTFTDYELIIVDSIRLGFNSAASALNYGASIAHGDLLLFIHQDVSFLSNDGLQQIIDYSRKYDFGIAGVAGAIGEKKFEVASSVVMGAEHIQAGRLLTKPMRAFALDECLLIVKASNFLKFDNYGRTWHLYGPEYCYRILDNYQKVLLFPISIYHMSAANSLNYNYFDTLLLLAKKNKHMKLLRTCCGYFKNNFSLKLYCLYRKLKLYIKHIYERGK